jgi:hypothetical protein
MIMHVYEKELADIQQKVMKAINCIHWHARSKNYMQSLKRPHKRAQQHPMERKEAKAT